MKDARDDVQTAADRLMAAFSTGDEGGYFECFHPDATFFFYGLDPIGSREEYRTAVRVWKEEHGFRVLSSASRDAQIHVFGDTAVLTHRVTTSQMWDGEDAPCVNASRSSSSVSPKADGSRSTSTCHPTGSPRVPFEVCSNSTFRVAGASIRGRSSWEGATSRTASPRSSPRAARSCPGTRGPRRSSGSLSSATSIAAMWRSSGSPSIPA
ncbi:MAG: YybH family protein [Actinomycetota bacterium]